MPFPVYSVPAGVRTPRRAPASAANLFRACVALAIIFLWTATPALAAVCRAECHASNMRDCCAQQKMPMRDMPNMPMPRGRNSNPPVRSACGVFVLDAAQTSVTLVGEVRSFSAVGNLPATDSFCAASGSCSSSPGSSNYFAKALLARFVNRGALVRAARAVPLRI